MLDEDGRNVYNIPCDDCEDSSLCSKGMTDVFAAFTKLAANFQPIKIPKHFLELLGIYSLDDYFDNPFCRECSREIRMSFDRNRADMWEEFPTRIELPSWEDIKDFDM